ncbi:MAG: CarD family transcriptional regulator [Salinispira sp.]
MPMTFKVSQQVVYPTHGVGTVTKIQKRDFNGHAVPYYTIHIETNDMTIMIPVDRAEDRGIRAIVSQKEAMSALDLMEGEAETIPSDWKMRYEQNRQHLLKGDVKDIARVVQTLYYRSKIKELPILERKLYDSAIKLLVDEVSISLKKTPIEVEELIFERLESEKHVVPPETEKVVPEVDDFDAGVDEDDLEINKEV